jgi:hypothetical protein
MKKKQDPEDALELANQLLTDFDDAKTDPVLAYAALGCAFIQLHKALGHSKQNFIDWSKEMAKLAWDKNEP